MLAFRALPPSQSGFTFSETNFPSRPYPFSSHAAPHSSPAGSHGRSRLSCLLSPRLLPPPGPIIAASRLPLFLYDVLPDLKSDLRHVHASRDFRPLCRHRGSPRYSRGLALSQPVSSTLTVVAVDARLRLAERRHFLERGASAAVCESLPRVLVLFSRL